MTQIQEPPLVTSPPDPGPGNMTPVVDPPPLWTPHDERVFRRAALTGPPSRVDGWSFPSRLLHFFLSSPRAILSRVGMVVALVFVIAALPELADDSSWGNLWRVAWYHAWVLVLLALVSTRLRALPAHRILAFVILGASAGALAVYYLSGPITDLTGSGTPTVWVTPPLEEAVKLLLVAGVLIGARRRLSQPGVIDLAIIGYAVGAGFAFHEDALWGRVTTSGFEQPWGLLFPSIVQQDNLFVVGHAAWTLLTAVGLGLIVLHWRRPFWVVLGLVLVVVPLADHMAINSRDGSFDWVVDVLFGHKLTAVLLLVGLAAGVIVDIRTRTALSERDHLLPSGRGHRPGDDPDPAGGFARAFAARRYQRIRNGVHYARHRDRAVWPVRRAAASPSTLTALGRTARLAGYPVGPRADMGWDLDPTDPSRARWFTPAGWTPYVAGTAGVGIDTAPGRPHAVAVTRHDPPANWGSLLALFIGLVATAIVIRLLTVPDKGPGGIQFGPLLPGGDNPDPAGADSLTASLPGAPNGPPRRMFGGAGAGGGGYGGGGGGGGGPDGPDGQDDPPPLPPDYFDGLGGGGPDGPPDDPPESDEDDCE